MDMSSVYVYRYFGTVFGRLKANVALVSATMHEVADHAAIWIGVNQPDNKSWVQGGVLIDWTETEAPTDPSAYIEIMPLHVPGTPIKGYRLITHPVKWDAVCKVTLHRDLRNRRMWTCKVTGKDRENKPFTLTSGKVNVPHPGATGTLETLGNVQAKATINGRTITTKKRP